MKLYNELADSSLLKLVGYNLILQNIVSGTLLIFNLYILDLLVLKVDERTIHFHMSKYERISFSNFLHCEIGFVDFGFRRD
jgi:hypothetical protein